MTDAWNGGESPRIVFVLPCYNEEAALHTTAKVLCDKVNSLVACGSVSADSSVLFVDDGSADATWAEIVRLHESEPNRFHGIKLAHNKGHQHALFAGLMHALDLHADAAISMDADLQDDPNAVDEMIKIFRAGTEIVYGVRNSRATDTAFKRGTAHAFYSVMRLMGTETIPDHADYRLMGANALKALAQYGEENLFLRGIVPSLGFSHEQVFYQRGTRVAGESKYPLRKMINFAIDGITSFSVKPLAAITGLGVLSVFVGLVMLIYTLVSVFSGHSVAGWGSMMCSLWLLGGLILVALGVIGEYIGKIYIEVKHRPRYIVERQV